MTKKLSIPADMEQQVMGHVRAILHMHMGDVCKAKAQRSKDRVMLRVIRRINRINTSCMKDINDVLLMHRLAAADDLVSLEAIHKILNKAQDAKTERQLKLQLPAGWHIEEGPISKQEFVVQDEPRKLTSRIDPACEYVQDGIRFEDEKGWNGDFVTEIDGDPDEIFKTK